MSNNQVRTNLFFNILSLSTNVLIGIFYTPYLISNLGLVAYGIIPLALIINQYISVVTGSLTSALTRFYSISLRQNKKEEASKYLSTSLIIICMLIFLLIFPLGYFISNVSTFFNIPNELVNDSKYLFTYTILSFFISLISSVLNITLYAYNRLDLMNIIKIIRVIGKFIFIVLMFKIISINIKYIGLANLFTEIIIVLTSIIFFFKFSQDKVKIKLNNFDKSILISVSSMAFWVIIQQLGDMGLYRIDNIIINKFWSTKESGIIGAFAELGNYTTTIASVISSLFGPLILIAYANEDKEEVKKLTIGRSLSVGILIAVMVGILGGFSPVILNIWLGKEFLPYNSWLMIKLILIPFYSAAGVFSFGLRALNKVRFPAIFTITLGIVNFLIIYYLALYNTNLSIVQWILIVGLILGIGQSYFLNGVYFAKFYEGTMKKVLMNAVKILFTILSIYCIGYFLSPYLVNINTIYSLILIGIISIILLVTYLKIMLSKQEINEIIALVYKK